MSRRGKLWLIAGGTATVFVILIGFATWYFVFRDDSPEAVDIETATQVVEERLSTSTATDSSTGIEGTWTIDASIGDFDDFTSSFAGYRVQEELAGIGAKAAVGRTPDVSGSLTISGTTIESTEIEIDMTTLTSDESRRDGSIRNQAIETDQFPTASFELTGPIELESVPDEGESIAVDATGQLTLHGVTQDVTLPLEAEVSNGVITVTGSLDIEFADYDISPPQSMIVLSVEDQGQMEFQLFFTQSG